jgi:predicted MFS family arabinose efflux permease
VLVETVTARVAQARRGLAIGALGAGGSLGQLALAPLLAVAIAAFGWQAALFALALAVLMVVPLARTFGRGAPLAADAAVARPVVPLRVALASRDYWLISAGYAVCGFHLTFLATHMPGVIDLCGLSAGFSGLWLGVVGTCSVASSLAAGRLMQHVPARTLLAAVYALRALGVLAFVAMPTSEATLLGFALWMGLTSSATFAPTSGLVAERFGTRNVATLLGFTLFVHQIGSFLGAWLGGIEREATGGYALVWWIDAALALAAAAAYLPLRAQRDASRAPELAAALR